VNVPNFVKPGQNTEPLIRPKFRGQIRSGRHGAAGIDQFYRRMELNRRAIRIFDQFDQFGTGGVTDGFRKLADGGQRHDLIADLHIAEAADRKILRHFDSDGIEMQKQMHGNSITETECSGDLFFCRRNGFPQSMDIDFVILRNREKQFFRVIDPVVGHCMDESSDTSLFFIHVTIADDCYIPVSVGEKKFCRLSASVKIVGIDKVAPYIVCNIGCRIRELFRRRGTRSEKSAADALLVFLYFAINLPNIQSERDINRRIITYLGSPHA